MPAKSVILGTCAALALSIAAAQAGPCSSEIEGLSKTMASKDAGAGPTSGASGSASSATPSAGQHPPTTAMSQATQGSATSPQDVRQQTAGQPTAAQQGGASTGSASAHPPTAATTQATQGQTAPSAGGHPPTAAMSQQTQGQAAPNVGHQTAAAGGMDASAALAHARELDKQGKEAECMQAVQQAKQLSGTK